MQHYIFDPKDKTVIPATTDEWATWFERASRDGTRQLQKDKFHRVKVSTVFIGIDEDELFETMIFGGPEDGYQVRSKTYDEAIKNHIIACEIAKKSTKPDPSRLG